MERSEFRTHFAARLTIVASVVCAVVLACFGVLVSQVQAASVPTVYSGPTDRPQIALTFDDNFNTTRALAVLSALRRLEAPATMFVVGDYVRGVPEVTASLARGDFEIADHSMSHPDLTKLSWSRLLEEVGGGSRTFTAVTGVRTAPLMRPPYGATNATVSQAAAQNGFLYVVNWSIDTQDWTGVSADTITNRVLSNARNGAIVLMHLSAPHTYEAVPGIVQGLRARGFELVTVSRLLKGDRRFLDVPSSGGTATAIGRMVDMGIMSGFNEEYFGPEDGITRAQVAKVMVLVAGLHTPEVERVDKRSFVDVVAQRGVDGSWLAFPFDYVEEAAAAGLVQGRFDALGRRVFDPYGPVTRVQLARIVARMARQMKGYVDGPPAQMAFRDVMPEDAADVALVATLGLMQGYNHREFRPDEGAARKHVAVVAGRFLDLPPRSH